MLTANKTVQRRAYIPGALDSHGNPTDSWGDPVDVDVYGWVPSSGAGGADVNTAGRLEVISDIDILAPAGTTAFPNDRFIIAGDTYLVMGHAEDFTQGPFGYKPGVRINLNRSEG